MMPGPTAGLRPLTPCSLGPCPWRKGRAATREAAPGLIGWGLSSQSSAMATTTVEVDRERYGDRTKRKQGFRTMPSILEIFFVDGENRRIRSSPCGSTDCGSLRRLSRCTAEIAGVLLHLRTCQC